MRWTFGPLRGVAAVMAAVLLASASFALACPRGGACPEMRTDAGHSCCEGEGSRPASRQDDERPCPGDCCRVSAGLPEDPDGAATVLVVVETAGLVYETLPRPVIAAVRPVPVERPPHDLPLFLKNAALLI